MFVGAAVSSAEAYFINFIVRLFENIDKGFSSREHPEKCISVSGQNQTLHLPAVSRQHVYTFNDFCLL